jgi:hypothetical protein
MLALGTSATYSSIARADFIDFDDQYYVTQNPHVQDGLSWKTVVWAVTATDAQNWHPLTWLSHALDYQLYGLNPAGHHLTNLVFHVLNVVLLFLLLLGATGAMGRSLLVAALFALHPLNVESVAWVAERKNVLSTLFFLLALGAYGWYARRPNRKRYLVLATLFVLGLASKPMVITLPFVLLLLDFWPLQRIERPWEPSVPRRKPRRKGGARSEGSASGTAFPLTQVPFSRLVLEKLPLLALCAGSAVVTIVAQRTVSIRSLENYPFGVRFQNAVYSYAMYIWQAFWPLRLAVYYPHPGSTLSGWQVAVAALFLGSVTALVWKLRLAHRYLVTGWLWYIGTLVPVIGLVQVGDQARADRYAYIPLIGIFVMVVWGATDWADGKSINLQWRTATAVTILASLSFLTWLQASYWRNGYLLWSHTLQVVPNNTLAIGNLGDALLKMGHAAEALPMLQQSVKLYPADAERHGNLAVALVQSGRLGDAILEYQTAISLASDATMQAHFYDSLAAVYDVLGDYAKLRESYRQAIKVDPQRTPDMIRWMQHVVTTEPTGPHYLQLAILLQQAGNLPDAVDAYQRALKLDPKLQEAEALLHVPPGKPSH